MIKSFLQRWLGIQELSDNQAITRARVNNLYGDKPISEEFPEHEPTIVESPEKPITKGYVD